MLWNVLGGAASRTQSRYQAAQRLYPDTQDLTFWNRLHANLPKQVPARERRLNELLRLPNFLPGVGGRLVPIAIDYHAIPYSGLPQKSRRELRRGKSARGTNKFSPYATACGVVAGWRYTRALTWVKEPEQPATVLDRRGDPGTVSKIACTMVRLDRYFCTVPVMTWLQTHHVPFIIPVVIRGRKPKPGTKAQGMRSRRADKAGPSDYTHHAGKESVTFHLVINYKTYRHRPTKKRTVKKLFFATWKVRLSPTDVRETDRRRFGIETSYRPLNQSRSRTSSRDPRSRFLLVGLALFLRNLGHWLANMDRRWGPPPKNPRPQPPPAIKTSSMTSETPYID